MKLQSKDDLLPGKRAVYAAHGRYYGWTGYEYFGVISCYRYYGYHVTCWATVECRSARYFYLLKDAIDELDYLMDKADALGELSHLPVGYFEPPCLLIDPVERALLGAKDRVPYWSPANRERQIKQYPNCNQKTVRALIDPEPVVLFRNSGGNVFAFNSKRKERR